MCLKAVKIDEGHRAITLKKAGPAIFFEKIIHRETCQNVNKKSADTSLRNHKYVSKVLIALKVTI